MLKKNFSLKTLPSLFTGLCLALILILIATEFGDRPGWIVYDWLQRLTALQSTPDVALILVDQNTIDQLSSSEKISYPFPRQLYGLVNSVGQKVGARGILYDILFTEPSVYGVEDDQAFAAMIREAKVSTFLPAASEKGFVKNPVKPLLDSAAALGGVHFKVDLDGVFRRAPPFLPGPGQDVLSLPETAFRSLTKSSSVPTSPLLRFYKPDAIPFISFYELILAYRLIESGQPVPENILKLKNRVWIVGFSAPGLHDLKSIPTDNEAPGVLVPATALANRFARISVSPITRGPYLVFSFVILISMLFAGTRLTSPRWSAALVGVFFPILVLGITLVAWELHHWFNPFPLFVAGFVVGTAQLLVKFYTYWAERRKFAKSLEYSMSPEMVKLIKSGQLEVERYGEQREISILFCDIVGFTKISERLEPRQLVSLLNMYSDAAVDLIFTNGGYVDKFIGDAVMAFWGAPIPQDDHAKRALEIAIRYPSAIESFNARMQRVHPHFPALQVRIGLHTGFAIVGNIGAKKRHNYTAIGDGVNLASRLESLAKSYHCPLLISEDAVRRADALERTDLLELDQVVVQGRTQSTRIYTYVGNLNPLEVQHYKEALKHYYRGDWSTALRFFEQSPSIPASMVMAERCRRSLSEGSLKEWHQGAWNHEFK